MRFPILFVFVFILILFAHFVSAFEYCVYGTSKNYLCEDYQDQNGTLHVKVWRETACHCHFGGGGCAMLCMENFVMFVKYRQIIATKNWLEQHANTMYMAQYPILEIASGTISGVHKVIDPGYYIELSRKLDEYAIEWYNMVQDCKSGVGLYDESGKIIVSEACARYMST